jgi:hypothetical protein
MKRINVTFYDEIIEKLEARTKAKKYGSVAQSIRELIDLGLRIEEAANQNSDKRNEKDELGIVVDVMKNNLRWTLESLLIIRQILERINANGNDQTNEILQHCKEQALNHVNKMFVKLGETIN